MTRFILGTLGFIAVVGLCIVLEGGNPVAYLMFTPAIIALVVPLLAMMAVWPMREWITAWKDAFAAEKTPTAAASSALWAFVEKATYAAAAIGTFAGIILTIANLRELSELGKPLAACLLCLFYSAVIGLVCRILRARVERRRG
jgi:flagellar motor component MotA